MELSNIFIHHVFFWCSKAEDVPALVAGLKKLSQVKTIKQFHIGAPAATNRGVIDNTYSVSWMLVFESAGDQESYQVDPVHLEFVKECSALWHKVVVYDAIDA